MTCCSGRPRRAFARRRRQQCRIDDARDSARRRRQARTTSWRRPTATVRCPKPPKTNNTTAGAIQIGSDLTRLGADGASQGRRRHGDHRRRHASRTRAAALPRRPRRGSISRRTPRWTAVTCCCRASTWCRLWPPGRPTRVRRRSSSRRLPLAQYNIIAKADADNVVHREPGDEQHAGAGHPDRRRSDRVHAHGACEGRRGRALRRQRHDARIRAAVRSGRRSRKSTCRPTRRSMRGIRSSGAAMVPDLAAGATSAGSTTVTTPAEHAGGLVLLDCRRLTPTEPCRRRSKRTIPSREPFPSAAICPCRLSSLPATAGAGASIVVSDTTANQGGGGSPASVTRFYLSANSTLDAGDVRLDESRAVPALAAGASSAGSTSVTIPSGTGGRRVLPLRQGRRRQRGRRDQRDEQYVGRQGHYWPRPHALHHLALCNERRGRVCRRHHGHRGEPGRGCRLDHLSRGSTSR